MTEGSSGQIRRSQSRSKVLPTQLVQYGVALLSVALALGTNLLFSSYLESAPTPVFFAAVMVSAWYGGLGSGLLATALSTLAINSYIEPLYSLSFNNLGHVVRLGVFVMAALLISSLNQAQRSLQRKVEANFQALHASEARFGCLAESNIIGMLVADLDGTILEANHNFLNLVGYTEEELRAGRLDWRQITDPESLEESERAVQELLTTGACTPFEKKYIHKDGSRIPILHGAVMTGENTIIGFVLDLRERKRVEVIQQEALRREQMLRADVQTANAQLETVLASLNDQFLVLDREWRYIYVSDRVVELVGKSKEKLLGHCIWDIFPDTVGSQFYNKVHQAVAEQRILCFEYFYPAWQRWLENRVYPSNAGVSILVTDITDRKQTEEALRQSEERLRVALKSSPITVFNQDEELRYTWIYNPAFGHRIPEVIGKQDQDLLPEDDAAILTRIKRHVLETGSGVREEVKLTMHNQDFYYDLAVEPLQAEDGETVGVTCASMDITERKQMELALQQSETTLNALIASSPIGIAFFDRDLRYIHANEALAATNGIPLNEHMGRTLGEVLPQWAPAIAPVLQQVMDTQEPLLNQEITGVTYPSDRMRYGLVNYFPVCLTNGEILGVGVTSVDISDRKQAEAEREQLLAREKTTREEAETANRIKDEFLAVLSHELRSPLNPILGWSRLLQTQKLDEQKTQQALATIERNAKLQTQLIEDLLDVSRILRGKLVLNIAPVSLINTIEEALETVRLAVEAKEIQIQRTLNLDLDQVMGDAARLQQVIWNLLTNAVKFTPSGGMIEIRLEQSNNQIQIQVRDTGKGIRSDFLPYVFDYFRQEDGTTTRRFGGLGLGLAIVRHITELHGGTVWAESLGEGMGATFTVQLPLMPSPVRVDEEDEPSTVANLSGLRVLAVDDDDDIRELLEFILQQAGAEVRVVASATEALQQLEIFSPKILISDVGMPDIDGYMLMRQIRTLSPERGKIPAIALTAYAGEIDQQQAIAAGFQMHLTKPIEPEKLINGITNLLKENSISEL